MWCGSAFDVNFCTGTRQSFQRKKEFFVLRILVIINFIQGFRLNYFFVKIQDTENFTVKKYLPDSQTGYFDA